MNKQGLRAALALEASDYDREQVTEESINAIPEEVVETLLAEILTYSGQEYMPPAPHHLRLLMDAISFLHDGNSRADAWAMIGIQPKDGRGYLGSKNDRTPWAVFFTARFIALDQEIATTP